MVKKNPIWDLVAITVYKFNLDGDDLPQYNLGMFCNEETRTPLNYNRYNGSLTDRSNLSNVLANAKSMGIRYVKMILDGGFWSEECIQNLSKSCDAFTVGMPAFLKESGKILDQCQNGIEEYANELRGYHMTGRRLSHSSPVSFVRTY